MNFAASSAVGGRLIARRKIRSTSCGSGCSSIASAVKACSSLSRARRLLIVPFASVAGWRTFASWSRVLRGSGRLSRQPNAASTSITTWARGFASAGRSRSLLSGANSHARRGVPRLLWSFGDWRSSGSNESCSAGIAWPVTKNRLSTSCSAVMRRRAGESKSRSLLFI